jgi:O-antigen/teichoic acid export membrane protein
MAAAMNNIELVQQSGGPPAVAFGTRPDREILPMRLLSMLRAVTGVRRNALLVFGLRIVSAAIAYLSQVALARWMGWQDYGLYIFAWTWVLLIGGLTSLGFNIAAIRLVAEYRETGRIAVLRGFLLASRLITLVVSACVAGLVAAVVWSIAAITAQPQLVTLGIVLVAIPAYALTDIQDGIGRGSARMVTALFAPYILRPLLILAGIAVVYWSGHPLDAISAAGAAVVATWIAWGLQTIVLERKLRAMVPPGPRLTRLRSWMGASLPLMFVYACDLALQNTDVIVIAAFESTTQAGVYFAAAKTMALMLFVMYAAGSAWGNRFAAIAARGDSDALRRAAEDAVRWTFWPSLALGALMIAAGRPLLALFGPEFIAGYPVMCILVVAFLVRAAIGPVDVLLNMTGGQGACARATATAAGVNIVLNIAMVPMLGLVGAALAVSISLVLGAVLNYRAARQRFGFDFGIWTELRRLWRG